jgi:branched-chain amino acid transport system permease protein
MKSVVRYLFALLGALVVVPLLVQGSPYWTSVVVNITVLSFLSLGVWLTFAIGRINIAQGAFALVGGYTAAILCTRFGWSFFVALPLAGLTAGVVGGLLGTIILRLRGVYFSMLTLCLTEAARLLALNWKDLTKGATGIIDIPTPFQGDAAGIQSYFFGVGLLILGIQVVRRIMDSRIGGIFRTIRSNEDLAASFGIPVARYRVLAFTLACVFGGLGGALLTVNLQSIYPSSFTVVSSTNDMLYCFLGGLQSVFGPVLGAGVLFLGFQVLQVFGPWQNLAYAAAIILTMLLLPNGLLSVKVPRFRRLRGTAGASR